MVDSCYTFFHDTIHVCFWTVPAIAVGALMAGMGIVSSHNQKKREKKFEEELAEKLENQ
jgi:hypothetical protein